MNKLLTVSIATILILVTSTPAQASTTLYLSGDYVQGRDRICTYSGYGLHASQVVSSVSRCPSTMTV